MRRIIKRIVYFKMWILARLVLWKYRPKIVAVTGSVGKTSTKDAIFAALSPTEHVRKSEKSYNSQIGVPLTVLGVPNGWDNLMVWTQNILKGCSLVLFRAKYPKWLVLEVGVGKPGDMRQTAGWLHTDAVVMTAIGETPVHIEFFDSREHLIEEKSELIETLKSDGLLVLNQDDPAILEMRKKTKCRIATYGFTAGADVVASGESIAYDSAGRPEGTTFHIDIEGKSLPVEIEGVFGRNHVYAALATLALAHGLKRNILDTVNSLKNYDTPPGRMRLIPGVLNSSIIDDSYNSSPTACESALKTLSEVKASRKIAILGDMLELGKFTADAHRKVGRLAKDAAEVLVVVGPRAHAIKEGALEAGMPANRIFEFLNTEGAREFVKNLVKTGDLILVKGSQGMRMERIVEDLILDRENKGKLLVRQEPEWLARS